MKRNKFFILFFVTLSIFLTSCTQEEFDDDKIYIDIPEHFETNTQEMTFANAISIHFSGNEVEISNPYKEEGITITTQGAHVMVESTLVDKEVNYVLSGNTLDGSIKIYSEFKFGLVMNGVCIINTHGAAINIQSGKKISVLLVDRTFNRLVDSEVYPETSDEDMKATFFSEGQLIFDGKGSLSIYGLHRHAICSDDFIEINDGKIIITVAASDGIHVNDYFVMNGGDLTVYAYSDGIDCEQGYIEINGGNITIDSDKNGIYASYEGDDSSIIPYIRINDGSVQVITTGKSANGIESKDYIYIFGGTTEVEAYDDGIKSLTDITITGGYIYCYSETGDGIDAEGALSITGGLIVAYGTGDQNGIECDGTRFFISGGTVISMGGETDIPTYSLQPSVIFTSFCAKDQLFRVESTLGEEIITFRSSRKYSSLTLLLNTSNFRLDKEYKIYVDGNISGGDGFHGYYSNTSYVGGKEIISFILDSVVQHVTI